MPIHKLLKRLTELINITGFLCSSEVEIANLECSVHCFKSLWTSRETSPKIWWKDFLWLNSAISCPYCLTALSPNAEKSNLCHNLRTRVVQCGRATDSWYTPLEKPRYYPLLPKNVCMYWRCQSSRDLDNIEIH